LFVILSGIVLRNYIAPYPVRIFGEDITSANCLLFVCILLSFSFIAIVAHIIIHEAGHLIFGLLSGYRFVSIRVFSFLFIKQDGKIVCKRYSLMGTSGQCLMAPPEPYTDDLPTMLFNFGGVIAGLIASALTLVLYIISQDYPVLSLFF